MSKNHSNADHSNDSGPIVSGSAVLSAGLASAGAAIVTSRFGVAGTLIGAALTTMIITGGAAILKAYMENATGKVRGVSGRLRVRREQRKARHYTGQQPTVPGRPDLRNNVVGRMRAAMNWFSRLPVVSRRSILIKGLIAAVVAFLIGIAVIYAAERLIGNNFSCGFWGNCPPGATAGIHPLGYGGTGAGSSVGLGRQDAGGVPRTQGAPVADPSGGQRNSFFGGQQDPSSAPAQSGDDASSASSSSSAEPETPPEGGSSSASSSAQPEEGSSASSSAQPEGVSSAPSRPRESPSSAAPSSATE